MLSPTRTPGALLTRHVPRKRPAPVPGLVAGLLDALRSGTVRRGPDLLRFERALAERLGVTGVSAVGSGRLALLLALEALEVRAPATILLPSYNASCVPNVLAAAGYGLWFVDVDRETLLLDPAALPARPPADARALVVTHVEGNPARMEPLLRYARSHGLALVEDAAHALGATVDGEPAGALADAAIFSLGRGKHLNTLGGGVVAVRSEAVAGRLAELAGALEPPAVAQTVRAVTMELGVRAASHPALYGALAMPLLRSARSFGRDPVTTAFEDDKSALDALPGSLRRSMGNLQARVGLEGLAGLDRALSARRENAARLRARLEGALPMQRPTAGAQPSWLELTVLPRDRDRFQRRMLARGVDTQRTWMDACDALPAFAGAAGGPCPVSREVAARAVYLPTYPDLRPGQVEHVAQAALAAAAEDA